jgi:putative hydrolase of the HAD superfamily
LRILGDLRGQELLTAKIAKKIRRGRKRRALASRVHSKQDARGVFQQPARLSADRLLEIAAQGGIALPAIRAIFWDVGGVLLTNAWDRTERRKAFDHFHLDEEEFHDRHEMVASSFERGKITLDEYLERTVFYRTRSFTRDEFRDFMYSLSKPLPDVLGLAQALADSRQYLMGTINNESRELNNFRLEKFGLRKIFRLFVSSCFVGLRKPESGIYRLALEITQVPADECCFIDDRALNLECALKLGMHTIEMQTPAELREDLGKLGVKT